MTNLSARLLLVFGATGVYFLLAVLGAGGIAPYLSKPPLTALVLVTFALAVVSLFAGGNISPGVRENRDNRWVLIFFFGIGLLLGFVPAFTDRENFWTLDGDAVRWIGVVLFAVGGAVRLWPVFVLGDRFSGLVAIQKGHTLVTDGPYRYIRNPSYLGLIINSLGWSLAFRSGVGIILVALMMPALVARMFSEERLLRDQFGEEYAAYYARTWRLVPGLF